MKERPINKQIPVPSTIDELIHYQLVLLTELQEQEEHQFNKKVHEIQKHFMDYLQKVKQ